MMDVFLHIVGACTDTNTHIDLIDILLCGTTASPFIILLKLKFKFYFEKWKRIKN